MPGLVPGIHAVPTSPTLGNLPSGRFVDGRVKPGHDAESACRQFSRTASAASTALDGPAQ